MEEKMEKKVIIGLILISLYSFVWDFLKIINIVEMTADHAKTFNILFSLSTVVILGLLIKNRYWIIAWTFRGLYKIARIFAAIFFKTYHDIYNWPIIAVMIAGMVCSLASLFYFYKLLKVKDFSFEGNIRLKDWSNYLKKKFRS